MFFWKYLKYCLNMKIIKATLPANSILNQTDIKYDYIDSYMTSVIDKNNRIKPVDIGRAFFSSGPEWVDKLFALRNKIVAVFGLKTSNNRVNRNRRKLINHFKCEAGEQIGLFKVFARTDKEVVLGEDDKHLNFRISLFLDDLVAAKTNKNLTISTTVIFHNCFGRLYFIFVRPFHSLIVPTMLRGIVKELEKTSNSKV
jgi:hypothetical protein